MVISKLKRNLLGLCDAKKIYTHDEFMYFDKYLLNVTLFEDYVIHPHSLDSIKLTNIFSR